MKKYIDIRHKTLDIRAKLPVASSQCSENRRGVLYPLFILFLLLTFITVSCDKKAVESPFPSAKVTVHITSSNGDPIDGAVIHFTNPVHKYQMTIEQPADTTDPTRSEQTRSGSQSIVFPAVVFGNYTITISHENYEDYEVSFRVDTDPMEHPAELQRLINTITFDPNGADDGDAPEAIEVGRGTTITIPDEGTLTKEENVFEGWNTLADGTGDTYEAGDDYLVTDDATLYAMWKANEYTVTFHANGGTGLAPEPITEEYGTEIALPSAGALFKTGHTFEGWNTETDGSGTNYDANETFIVTEDITLYANWEIIYHTLTFDGNGQDSGDVPTAITETYGTEITIPVQGNLSKTGHSFGGWNTEADGTGTNYAPNAKLNLTSSFTLYAKWDIISYTVTYNGNGNTAGVAPTPDTVPYGSDIALPTAGTLIKAGFDFAGWNTQADGSGTNYNANATYKVVADTTLYAKWNPAGYTIAFSGNGNDGGTAPEPIPSYFNAEITLPGAGSLTKTHHTFIGWNTQADTLGTDYAAGATYKVTGAATLYAKWRVNKYTLTFDGNGHDSGDVPIAITQPYGTEITIPGKGTLDKDRMQFKGWNTHSTNQETQGTNYKEGDKYTITGNATLYAFWDLYTITYHGNGATGTPPPPNRVLYGTLIDLPEDISGLTYPQPGYSGVAWMLDPNGTSEDENAIGTEWWGLGHIDFEVTKDDTLYVYWEQIIYTVSYSGPSLDIGSYYPDTQHATWGEEITIQGIGDATKAGHTFVEWNDEWDGSGTTYDAGDKLIVKDYHYLYAIWEAELFTITFDGNGHTGGNPPAPITDLTVEDPIQIPGPGTMVKTGHTFYFWCTTKDGTGDPYMPNSTYLAKGNDTLWAQWTPNRHTITLHSNDLPNGQSHSYSLLFENINYGTKITLPDSTVVEGAAPWGYVEEKMHIWVDTPITTYRLFNGWNTKKDGTGAHYNAKVPNGYTVEADTTLYAQWKQHTITYNLNGATSGGSAPASFKANHLETVLLYDMDGHPVYEKTGHVSHAWNTQADGEGVWYNSDFPWAKIVGDMTLYVYWKPKVYIVKYDGNGNTDGTAPSDDYVSYGDDYTVSGPNTLEKDGYNFIGWNTAANGSGTSYTAGQEIVIDMDLEHYGDFELYAQWEQGMMLTITNDIACPDATYFDPALKAVLITAVYVKPSDGTTWSSNILSTYRASTRTAITTMLPATYEAGDYDIRLEDSNGYTYTRINEPLTSGNKDVTFPRMIAAANPRDNIGGEKNFDNDTGYPIEVSTDFLFMKDRYWFILENDASDNALVHSVTVTERKAFDDRAIPYSWADSVLRTYLKSTYITTFSTKDQNRMVEKTISTPVNPFYGTDSGTSADDKIFILSADEVATYFGASNDFGDGPSDAALGKRIAMSNDTGEREHWWLRTAGENTTKTSYVNDWGTIYLGGTNGDATNIGIRPAIWINKLPPIPTP